MIKCHDNPRSSRFSRFIETLLLTTDAKIVNLFILECNLTQIIPELGCQVVVMQLEEVQETEIKPFEEKDKFDWFDLLMTVMYSLK